jgi:iron complex outermembrane receptor protein
MDSFLPGWDWDVSFQYSKSDGEYLDDQVLEDSLEMPFWRTGSCAGQFSTKSNKECVDIDWFDPDFLFGEYSAAERNFLFDTEIGTTEYTQWSVEGFVSGEVFEMPAGAAAAAIGFHYREDELNDTPGPITLDSNGWGASAAGITAGEDSTSAIFAEIDIPLLADKPLIDRLDFNGSVRYTDVESYGDDTTYKVGLNWTVNDQFRVRSTFGTSFRTPALYELYLADQTSFVNPRATDPCVAWGSRLASGEITQRTADNCAADGLPPDHLFTVSPTVVTGGGLGVLSAETSEATTFGVVWQPEFTELSLSVDYYDILVEDEVDVIGSQDIVHGCYESNFFPNEPLCDLFDRSAPTDPLPNAITLIRDSFINVSKQQLRGLDVAIQWVGEMPGNWGVLSIDSQHTFNFEDTLALFDETEEDLSGLAGHPEWVGNLNFTLDRDQWSFFYGINFIGETDNLAHFGRNTVSYVFGSDASNTGTTVEIDLKAEATTYHSLSASYEFGEGYTARLGVANVLDELPPRMTNQGTSGEVSVLGQVSFYSQYDWLARRYFFNVSKNF